MGGGDINNDELESDPIVAHNNKMEAGVAEEVTIDEALLEQIHSKQESVLR